MRGHTRTTTATTLAAAALLAAPALTVTAAHAATATEAAWSTQFTLAFLSEKDEPKQAITPDKAVVTPPDNKSSASLPWKWGPVAKQEGATHPGNRVGPIGATVKAGGDG